jgi:PAS domain S-box-containing protein
LYLAWAWIGSIPRISISHRIRDQLKTKKMEEQKTISPKDPQRGLAELQQQLALITDHVLEILFELSLEGVVLSINASAERALGYHPRELIGKSAFDFIHPEDRERTEEVLHACATTGKAEIEVRCRQKSGAWVHLACFGGLLRDECGAPRGLLVGGRNIGLRKTAEAALQRLESRFQSVWENSRDAMRLIDADGTLVQVNDAFCRMVGKSRSELIGKPFVAAYGYKDPEAKLRKFQQRVLSRSVPAQLERELPLGTGEAKIFELSNSLLEVEEQPLILTIYRDITDRRRKEEELQVLNETLKQRANQLGALTLQVTRAEQQERRRLAQIVHDHLQQLLVAARMTAERVRRRISEDEVVRAALEVEELLDESIKASRSITTELSPPILHDGGLIPALEWLGRRMKEKHHLQVHLSVSAEMEPASEVLRVFLFQAVRELLFNSFKHSEAHEAFVTVSSLSGDLVEIVVEDHGRGFDVDEITLGRGSSRDCFGLFSLKERIGHIGGSMAIQAAPGEGTRVVLVVPLRPQIDEAAGEARRVGSGPADSHGKANPMKREGGGAGKIRLVLVDDHKIMRQGLRELLREQPDMEVVGEAENGLAGIQMAHELKPDLVVMDVTMPVMNGIEATRTLSRDLPQSKIVGLSMHEKEDMAEAMLEAGAVAYVTKAAASETLTSTIRECLGRSCEATKRALVEGRLSAGD